jgi:hypothetical protein
MNFRAQADAPCAAGRPRGAQGRAERPRQSRGRGRGAAAHLAGEAEGHGRPAALDGSALRTCTSPRERRRAVGRASLRLRRPLPWAVTPLLFASPWLHPIQRNDFDAIGAILSRGNPFFWIGAIQSRGNFTSVRSICCLPTVKPAMTVLRATQGCPRFELRGVNLRCFRVGPTTSENAVKTQTWCAVATYVLIAIVKKELQLNASLYTCPQILSVSIFEKTAISCALQPDRSQREIATPANQLILFDFQPDTSGAISFFGPAPWGRALADIERLRSSPARWLLRRRARADFEARPASWRRFLPPRGAATSCSTPGSKAPS